MTDEEIDAALSLVTTGSPREQLEYRYNGFNLLTILIRLRQYEQAKRLLDNGFPVDANNVRYICTALTHAAYLGDESAVRLLLARGACIEGHATQDMTPLHEAAREGNTAMVRLLLQSGANVNAPAIHDSTPLDFASTEEVARVIEEAGGKHSDP